MRKILYHGSDVILKKPLYGVGKEDNDYGSGFYTTEDIEKAREWAWVNGSDKSAVCNQYSIDLDGLNVLNLDEHGTLAWIAEVTNHRGASDEFTQAVADKLVEMYKIDTSKADVIIGYRADDSYMNVVKSFLRNQLSVDEVKKHLTGFVLKTMKMSQWTKILIMVKLTQRREEKSENSCTTENTPFRLMGSNQLV